MGRPFLGLIGGEAKATIHYDDGEHGDLTRMKITIMKENLPFLAPVLSLANFL